MVAVAGTRTFHEIAHTTAHCARADLQLTGDLLVSVPEDDEAENFPLVIVWFAHCRG